MENFSVGDAVLSLKGRDKGEVLLIIKVKDGFVYAVNGKSRKIGLPKKKSVKHISMLKKAVLTDLALKIDSGAPVADKRLRQALKTVKE